MSACSGKETIVEGHVEAALVLYLERLVLKYLLLLHFAALMLGSTSFTIVTAPFGITPFCWSYLAYNYANGFGYVYQSAYSLPVVLTYLVAYGSGIAIYRRLCQPQFLGTFAASVCLAGFLSFALEFTHWFSDHHLSLIASFPGLVLPIAIWTIIVQWHHQRLRKSSSFQGKPYFPEV
jgi:hypothetical protein